MTTIAFRDGVMAADTSVMAGYSQFDSGVPKIAKMADGRLAGAAGSAGFSGAWIRWCLTGALDDDRPVPQKDDTGTDRGIIVNLDRSISVFESEGWFVIRPRYYAMGSGKDHAFGTMFAGADAETAVRAAIEHDASSRYGVTVLRLGA